MSYFPGLKLTKAGEQLLAKVSGNLSETISFRKAELGSGTINSDDEIRFLTALKEKWKDVNISDCKIVGNEQTQVQIELQFDNAGINTNKIFRELGIYAAANDGREVLFAYSNAKENFDYIPAATDNPQSFVINILITITSNTKVNAQIDLNSYVTLRKFNEELAKKLDKGAVSTEYDTAAKIEAKIKEAKNTADNKLTKGSLPAGISDAKTFYDLVEKGYGAELDENLFYLNDAGTKQVGKLYFDKNKKGLFKCIKQTTGTVNSTEFFVDASPNANSDRLANLFNTVSFSGAWIDYKAENSIKVKKDKKIFLIMYTSSKLTESYNYIIEPKTTTPIVEGTFQYDKSDEKYDYYHFRTSETDNTFILIQFL